MKKTIANINETESWLFGKINRIDKPSARLKVKKRLDSIKLEMKKERLQLTPYKYKQS